MWWSFEVNNQRSVWTCDLQLHILKLNVATHISNYVYPLHLSEAWQCIDVSWLASV